jgi:hypothetical protein
MSGMYTTHCAMCFIEFGMPKAMEDALRIEGRTFYCPNGHPLSFGEGKYEKTRRERDRLKQQLAEKDDALKRAYAAESEALMEAETAKKETKRLKRRASAGTCPCCKRTFRELARHMETQHPAFVAENVTPLRPLKQLTGPR